MATVDELREHIDVDPRVCFGKPRIKGTRIWVSLILDLLATGSTVDEILAEYPQISRENVDACILYGAEDARGRFFDVPVDSLR